MKVLSELDITNKRVFVRADLDVPVGTLMVNGESLIDDAEQATRLTNLKPTVDYLLRHGASQIVIAGHIDRPQKPDPVLSTKNLLPHLEAILGQRITFSDQLSVFGFQFSDGGQSVGQLASNTPGVSLDAALHTPGVSKGTDQQTTGKHDSDNRQQRTDNRIVLLENLRFWRGEVANDAGFAKQLASLADVYVNEAFGNSHRNHASMVALPALLPHAAGLHLQTEIETLSGLLKAPQRPFIAVVGGAKVETKVAVIENLAKVADLVIVGGELPLEIQKNGQKFNENVIVGKLTTDTNELSLESTNLFIEKIKTAKMVVWNGPVGKFEEGFEQGTTAIARAIIESDTYSVVGGGDTTQFLVSHDLLNQFSFVSAGGGAMLEFLAGKSLPGLVALE